MYFFSGRAIAPILPLPHQLMPMPTRAFGQCKSHFSFARLVYF